MALEEEGASHAKGSAVVLTALGCLAIASGLVSALLTGILVAVWIWGSMDSFLDPGFMRAGFTFVVWLIVTSVLSGILATLSTVLGATLSSIVAAVAGGFVAWTFSGVVWQAVLVAYTLAFMVWYAEAQSSRGRFRLRN